MKNIIGGLIPTLIWILVLYFIYSKEINKNYKLLLVYMTLGAIGSYLCYRLEMHFGSYFKKVVESNYWEILFYAIFGVAIFEEGYKWIISLTATKITKKNNILLVTLTTALGFTTFENIVFFALPYGFAIGIKRTLTAYVSHLTCAIIMAFFIEKSIKKKVYTLYSLIIPVLVHAIYNSFLYGGKYHFLFNYYYVLQLVLVIVIFKRMRKTQ